MKQDPQTLQQAHAALTPTTRRAAAVAWLHETADPSGSLRSALSQAEAACRTLRADLGRAQADQQQLATQRPLPTLAKDIDARQGRLNDLTNQIDRLGPQIAAAEEQRARALGALRLAFRRPVAEKSAQVKLFARQQKAEHAQQDAENETAARFYGAMADRVAAGNLDGLL
jgi:predicted  nucleic acid-binding Zn-ribbon protein